MRAKIQTIVVFFTFICVGFSGPLPKKQLIEKYIHHPAIQRFQKYIRIDTSQPENLKHAVTFWQSQAEELGLPLAVHEPAGLPVLVMTWKGADQTLPSIMLNSHMDVVPAEPDDWTYPPFSAYIDDVGDIHGRGTQDTKDVAIQYLEAIRKLKENNVVLQRTLHVTLMPDEETGGFQGMIPFVETKEFKDLNVGFALDEGLSSPDSNLYATYVDRRPWQIKFTVNGEGGHGSTMPDGTAIQKANKLVDTILRHRKKQRVLMMSKAVTDFGAYDSINVNVINGGVVANMIPSHASVVVDIRMAVSTSIKDMEHLVNYWKSEAGNGTTVEFLRQVNRSDATAIDETNPYWVAINDAATDMGINLKPVVCPATSDMVWIRNLGIPAIGLTAKTYTNSRIHASGEYLNAETFLKGIDFYAGILKTLGNL